ncbi:calcium-binding protein [Microvirga sp. Mcv34]|uniref:calcium-binding protein n=1 Tax=Microvirga sp. Mcv34 TaxID=2926016 RepID=UPI0021C7E278|nr:calcium-binding protein [Microvirga sp. Mcv34]
MTEIYKAILQTGDLSAGEDNQIQYKHLTAATGTTFLGLSLTDPDTDAGGIKATASHRLIVAYDITLNVKLNALDFSGASNTVYNEGKITSTTGTGLRFLGGGTHTVSNVLRGALPTSASNLGSLQGGSISGVVGIDLTPSGSTSSRLDLFNSGLIHASSGTIIIGGEGDDRVTNAGLFLTTATDGSLLVDLKNGKNFYDGTAGSYMASSGIPLNVTIKGGTGDDTFYGGAGSETFIGGIGVNVINGGSATDANQKDTVDYSWSSAALNVSLERTFQQWTGVSRDLLVNIENLTGGAFNDTLTGDTYANVLKGGAGNDTLEGGAGDDVLDGGSDENENNTALFSGSSAATVDLTILAAQNTGYGSDKLINIRNVETGTGADKLLGDAKDNLFKSGAGTDRLEGRGGKDTLEGGAGADTLVGGAGDDTLDGGSGNDTAEFSGNRANYAWNKNADGSYTIVDGTGQDGTDLLKDIRILKFADATVALSNTGPSSIVLSTSIVSESAAPGKIADIYGSDADGDTLTYTLMDSAGGLFSIDGDKLILNRALDYEAAKQHVISIKAMDPYGGEVTKAIAINVRNVSETTPIILTGTAGADKLEGDNGNDRLSGLAGNDELNGSGGNDMLLGGGGNDSLYGGNGDDTLIGGNGNDAMYRGAGKDVFVFDTKPNVKTNVEYLYDFNPADDTIHLKLSAFKGVGKKGALSKAAFWTGTKVHDSNDHILYNKKTGALFFDPDGTGSKPALQIAVMLKNLKLTYKDFFIV